MGRRNNRRGTLIQKDRKNVFIFSVDALTEEIGDVPNAPNTGWYSLNIEMTAVMLGEDQGTELWRRTGED